MKNMAHYDEQDAYPSPRIDGYDPAIIKRRELSHIFFSLSLSLRFSIDTKVNQPVD